MIAPARARRATFALAVSAALAGAPAAHAQAGPSIGGEVPSVLSLSLGEPSPFIRVRAGHRRSVYDATIPVEVTATDAPTRLSLADGEAIAGRRHGRLVLGASILGIPLRAAAGHGAYRSLGARVDPVLAQWSEPVSAASVTVRLRQAVRGTADPLSYCKLLLLTVTAGGP